MDNSVIFEGDCHDVIDAWLDILETKGGETGKKLVEDFHNADSNTYCGHVGTPCITVENLITVTIVDNVNGGAAALYGSDGTLDANGNYVSNSNNFLIPASMMDMPNDGDVNDLAEAGAFGHEIDHLEHDPLRTLNPLDPAPSGTVAGEAHAYSVQYEIYESMGIADEKNDWVIAADFYGDYKGKSYSELKKSPLKNNPIYNSFPINSWDKLYRNLSWIWE